MKEEQGNSSYNIQRDFFCCRNSLETVYTRLPMNLGVVSTDAPLCVTAVVQEWYPPSISFMFRHYRFRGSLSGVPELIHQLDAGQRSIPIPVHT